jgi:8-oxo-dGTP diphosphatase
MNQRTHVAVGVIYHATRDRVLISKRSVGQHLSGYWEFPGGKVENNEDILTALTRELSEELGIDVCNAISFTGISYNYPDKNVFLDVWKVFEWRGKPVNLENQEIRWVHINDLKHYKFPDANKYIIQSISLDPFYVISQDSYADYAYLLSVTEKCFAAGLKIFQLRLKAEKNKIFDNVVSSLSEQARQYNAKLILNGTTDDLKKYAIDGLHMNSSELKKYESRPVSEDFILGASCHDEQELIKAAELNVNYAFISPVLITNSHPDVAAIGWDKFASLTRKVSFPVYALGGMSPEEMKTALDYGAYGIAMIGAIWNSDSPERVISSYL